MVHGPCTRSSFLHHKVCRRWPSKATIARLEIRTLVTQEGIKKREMPGTVARDRARTQRRMRNGSGRRSRFGGYPLVSWQTRGLVWCGTLCASVGVAAQWSYWLLVAIVGVFLFQLLIWTVTWVLCPFWRHSRALLRYLCGRGGWHEVAHLHGISVYRRRSTFNRASEAEGTTVSPMIC